MRKTFTLNVLFTDWIKRRMKSSLIILVDFIAASFVNWLISLINIACFTSQIPEKSLLTWKTKIRHSDWHGDNSNAILMFQWIWMNLLTPLYTCSPACQSEQGSLCNNTIEPLMSEICCSKEMKRISVFTKFGRRALDCAHDAGIAIHVRGAGNGSWDKRAESKYKDTVVSNSPFPHWREYGGE